jgi:hypothetical protein
MQTSWMDANLIWVATSVTIRVGLPARIMVLLAEMHVRSSSGSSLRDW